MLRLSSNMVGSLILNSIKPVCISDGGWKIDFQYKRSVDVKKSIIKLALSSTSSPLKNVTSDYLGRLPSLEVGKDLNSYQSSLLLWNIWNLGLWGKTATAYLIAQTWSQNGSYSLEFSNPVPIHCPVEPVRSDGIDVGDVASIRRLGSALKSAGVPYEVNASLACAQNIFKSEAIFFHVNDKYITNQNKKIVRGLNCITFLDLALGIKSSNVADCDGLYIAEQCGADIILEGVKGPKMREYFSKEKHSHWKDKSFVFWWASHCAVIHKGIVCEYAKSKKGYNESSVENYLKPFNSSDLFLAEI